MATLKSPEETMLRFDAEQEDQIANESLRQLRDSVRSFGDASIASEVAPWFIQVARLQEPLTAGDADPAEGCHQMARALLNMAEELNAPDGHVPDVVQEVKMREFFGRLVDVIADIYGSEFIEERLNG